MAGQFRMRACGVGIRDDQILLIEEVYERTRPRGSIITCRAAGWSEGEAVRGGSAPSLLPETEVTEDCAHLLLSYPTHHLLLLLDRAPWHHGPALTQLLDENPRLELLYFPPACPDLNPQEHVWERARDAVSHNHTVPVFDRLNFRL